MINSIQFPYDNTFRLMLQLNADHSPDMTFQNRMQGTGVTTAELETIKSNLAIVFSNGKNIFYEKGITDI